jgi:hypothetical protein
LTTSFLFTRTLVLDTLRFFSSTTHHAVLSCDDSRDFYLARSAYGNHG